MFPICDNAFHTMHEPKAPTATKSNPCQLENEQIGQVSAAAHTYTSPRSLNRERREISPIKRRESDLKSMFGKIKVCGDSC